MLHQKLPDHWALLSGSKPFNEFSFESENIQIIYNCTNEPWADTHEHYHTDSDEIYIVLDGAMDMQVGDKEVHVNAGEYLCVPKQVKHKLKSVRTPHKSFVIRGPSIEDKVMTE